MSAGRVEIRFAGSVSTRRHQEMHRRAQAAESAEHKLRKALTRLSGECKAAAELLGRKGRVVG